MPYEDKKAAPQRRPHAVTLDERSHLTVTGVDEVVRFDDTEVSMRTRSPSSGSWRWRWGSARRSGCCSMCCACRAAMRAGPLPVRCSTPCSA